MVEFLAQNAFRILSGQEVPVLTNGSSSLDFFAVEHPVSLNEILSRYGSKTHSLFRHS